VAATSASLTPKSEKALVQLALDCDRAGGVLVEHRDVALLGRSRGGDAERAGELAQVVGVLDHVEAKRRLIERAVGEPGDERMLNVAPYVASMLDHSSAVSEPLPVT
jgi:hypothetical protein